MKKFKIVLFSALVFMLFEVSVYGFRLLKGHNHVVFADISAVIAATIAFGALSHLLIGYKRQGPIDKSVYKWFYLAIGVLLYSLGELTWMIYEAVLSKDPYPSVADGFWLLGYIPLFIGLLYAVRETRVSFFSARTPLLCLVAGTIIAVSFVFLMRPILASTEISLLEKSFDLAYPLLDLFLIIPTLTILIFYERGLLGKPWLFILSGFLCFTIGDSLFSYFSWIGLFEQYPYRMIDLLWLAGYLAIALGAIYSEIIAEMRFQPPLRSESSEAEFQLMPTLR